MAAGPRITAFFDEPTNTVSYLVSDPATRAAAIIDPVLDFDAASGSVGTRSAEKIQTVADEQGLSVDLLLETRRTPTI